MAGKLRDGGLGLTRHQEMDDKPCEKHPEELKGKCRQGD